MLNLVLALVTAGGLILCLVLGLGLLLTYESTLKGRLLGIVLLTCFGLTVTHIYTVSEYRTEVRLQERTLKRSLLLQTDYRLFLEDGSVYNLTFLDDNTVHFKSEQPDNNKIFNYLIIEGDLEEIIVDENGLFYEPTIKEIVFESETVSKTFIIETQENRNRELFGTLVTETGSQQVWMRSN